MRRTYRGQVFNVGDRVRHIDFKDVRLTVNRVSFGGARVQAYADHGNIRIEGHASCFSQWTEQ